MKLLLVAAATSTTGGGERHVADLLRAYARQPDIDLSLVCPPGGDLTQLANEFDVDVHHADIAEGISREKLAAVRAAIDHADPDVVHAHGSRAAMFARVADRNAAKRVVYTIHGIHIDKAGSAARQVVFKAIERRLRGRTAHFVTVCDSDTEKGAALGILDRERTTTVHNGIEPRGPQASTSAFRHEIHVADHVPLALSVGRLQGQKDQRTLLDAFSLVREQLPEAVLALVGSGPLEATLREHAIGLGLGASLRFVAPRPDLTPAYADADVFALSSLWEGFPYVILEAMDAGLSVVSTGVDGIPEAVDDGVTGLLVPPQDSHALAQALGTVLADTAKSRRMGEAGSRKVAEEFALDTMVERLLDVYREVAP